MNDIVIYIGGPLVLGCVLMVGMHLWMRRRHRKMREQAAREAEEYMQRKYPDWGQKHVPSRPMPPPVYRLPVLKSGPSLSLVDPNDRAWADTRMSVPLVEMYQDTAPSFTPSVDVGGTSSDTASNSSTSFD